jgi:hypothetical protein
MARRVHVDWDEAERLYESGLSTRDAADRLGISATHLARSLRKRGVRIRNTGGELERFEDRAGEMREGTCWGWTGAKNNCSYPTFKVGRHPDRRTVLAHRWAYEYFVGPIPSAT